MIRDLFITITAGWILPIWLPAVVLLIISELWRIVTENETD